MLFFQWQLTFMQLKDELPFPTKMVACYMSGEVLREAVVYSRRAGGKDGEVIERRGYAQCCDAIRVEEETDIITHIQDKPLDPSKIYLVALPRNRECRLLRTTHVTSCLGPQLFQVCVPMVTRPFPAVVNQCCDSIKAKVSKVFNVLSSISAVGIL
jgi:hypothetical protein